MLGVIYIQLSILLKMLFEQYRYFKNVVRTVSILQKFCSNSIDTSKSEFIYSTSAYTSKLYFLNYQYNYDYNYCSM